MPKLQELSTEFKEYTAPMVRKVTEEIVKEMETISLAFPDRRVTLEIMHDTGQVLVDLNDPTGKKSWWVWDDLDADNPYATPEELKGLVRAAALIKIIKGMEPSLRNPLPYSWDFLNGKEQDSS